MEKKWLEDPRTRSLQFTDRWVTGILKRSESPTPAAPVAFSVMLNSIPKDG